MNIKSENDPGCQFSFFVQPCIDALSFNKEDGGVDIITFDTRLRETARRVIAFAREYVLQSLPVAMAFHVYPNQSFDGEPRVGDEVVFPEESLPDDRYHGPWSAEDVVNYLWRSGKVPEWIDAAVESEDSVRSIVGLECCGRFTASDELLYHRQGGNSPFLIKTPPLPPRWESVEKSGRFDLYWRSKYRPNARR